MKPQSPGPVPHPAPGSGANPARGLTGRFALSAGVLMLAATAIAALLITLATLAPLRLDLTGTRSHRLAPQTQAVLARLDRPVELVIAAPLGGLDRTLRQRTADVLEQFQGATRNLTVTMIDTGSLEGLARYDDLIRRLAERHKPALERQAATIRLAIESADDAAKGLEEVSGGLLAIRGELDQATVSAEALQALRKYFEGEAAQARAFADELARAAEEARKSLAAPAEPLPVAPLDLIARAVRAPLAKVAESLSILSTALDRFVAAEGVPPASKDKAQQAARLLAGLRDRLARRVSDLDGLGTPAILTVARSLQRTRAALLIGEPPQQPAESGTSPSASPPKLAAIDPDALLPQPTINTSSLEPTLDMRFRSEELLAAALATFTTTVRPAAVIVHGGAARFGPSLGPFNRVAARLALRGVDCFEWPAAVDAQPPVIVSPDPKNPRPVAYFVIGMEVRRPEDAARMDRLASASKQLIADGKNVLIAASPSTLPASGASDPQVDHLEALGLKVETGLLLFEETRTLGPGGAPQRSVHSGLEFVEPGGTHPIAAAIRGAPTSFPLAIMPLRTLGKQAPAGVTITPIVTLEPRPSLWAESEWSAFYQSLVTGRPAQRLPAKDSDRDDGGGPAPWTIAAAVERRSDAFASGLQRVVVVGSMAWTLDVFADKTQNIDGRFVQSAAGNVELLHASAAWLTGRDELMVRSAEALATPVLPEIPEARLRIMRLALIAGLPLLVLLLGALWRAWRG